MPTDLVKRLLDALSRPLPGLEAQLRMAPRPRVGWDPLTIPEGTRDGAALLLIYPHDEALPGGGVDDGETIEAAAVREAEEEIGVDRRQVQVLGRLTPLHIPVSNFLLHPVVGVVPARPVFNRAEWEVARIIEPTLEQLRDPATVKREFRTRTTAGQAIQVDVPFFDLQDEKVWGATAMVLAEFCAILASL